MRKLIMAGIAVLTWILHIAVFSHLTILRISPDLFLVVAVCFCFFAGPAAGLGMAFFGGFMLDLFFSTYLGPYTLGYLLVVGAAAFLAARLYHAAWLPFAIVWVGVIVRELVFSAFVYFAGVHFNLWNMFISRILPEAVYTVILALPIYFGLKRLFKARCMRTIVRSDFF
ncbi:rod shape-determining protein MreD [Gehongia tenuis]|uniref:Rod shape-determining protein MreD n=1 Tax=Gehongia tenuis TaxID=2763655 RepID=A0A926D369_9FIRM|nr:rod shape-determining protein MreD [Gehongia tenuis]MBC8531550.1 rod shape-determining protein MreD [Gehongia tenuis]